MPFRSIITGAIALLILLGLGYAWTWHRAQLRAAKKETKAVVTLHQGSTFREVGTGGQQVATQEKVEVSKGTFRSLTKERIRQVEKESGLDLGNVSTLTEATVTTEREIKAPLHTDTLHAKTGTSDSFPTVVRRFRAATRFGTISGTITGDSISIRDSVANPLMLLETRPKWRLRHLWPWNWGKRPRQVKLLVMNPDSKIDTLSNISIVP